MSSGVFFVALIPPLLSYYYLFYITRCSNYFLACCLCHFDLRLLNINIHYISAIQTKLYSTTSFISIWGYPNELEVCYSILIHLRSCDLYNSMTRNLKNTPFYFVTGVAGRLAGVTWIIPVWLLWFQLIAIFSVLHMMIMQIRHQEAWFAVV